MEHKYTNTLLEVSHGGKMKCVVHRNMFPKEKENYVVNENVLHSDSAIYFLVKQRARDEFFACPFPNML